MFRKPIRVVAVLGIVVVLCAAVTVPAGARTRTATVAQGVTDSEIQVVALVADLDSLRAKGLIAQPKLTTGNLLKRWQAYADAYGPINGRKVVIKGVVWDPLDTPSYDKACTVATQDNKPFVIVNGNGYRQSSIACLTVDNKTPVIAGEPQYNELLKASGDNLFGLLPPSDVVGPALADVVAKQKLAPKTATVGILSGNEPGIKAGGDALEAELKKNGYKVGSKVETNILSGDASLQNRESAAAVATFKAAGVDTVFIGIPFTASQGYFQEANRTNAGFKTYVLDGASSMCTIFAASRTPLDAAGTPCLTAADTWALPTKDGVKKDNAAQAKCRTEFDKAFAQTSQPGVPSGDVVAGGVTYTEDFPTGECQIMNLLLPAIEKAGKKLTWAKVAANLRKTTKAPAIYASNGEGGYGPKKQYFANNVHVVTLNALANVQTPKDANGLFNGCPAPVNCWVPQLVDGEEWFPISQK